MSYDALAEHGQPRPSGVELMRTHRWPLLAMGLMTRLHGRGGRRWCGATGALALPDDASCCLPIFVWLYTLVFAFASAWFTHYCLTALHRLRRDKAAASRRHPQPLSAPPAASARPTCPSPLTLVNPP